MPSSTLSVLGKYQILAELGQGGFATVYRTHDPELGRDVALKILDPLLTRDPIWSARFRREARAVASLDHARIVTIYEIGQAEGALFIAMKLVEGGNLAQRLAGSGTLPWTEVVRLTAEIAEALDFAHGQGVLHRDLKPANVLLDPRTGAILTDFGLARMVADNSLSMSLTRGIVGTPAYVAPEVWEGKESSAQTDVYALGCIVYEMVTGQPRFGGDTPPAVMLAHFQPPPLPERWPEGVPAGLAEVLATALAREPKARYAKAGELATALAALGLDPLAEAYQALLAATAAGEWRIALDLAGKIKTQDATYRDVVALERQALAAMDQAARREQAKQWQQTATAALAASNIESARLAVRQWQLATPDDPALAGFLKQHQEVPLAKQTPLDATGPASVLASPVMPPAAATASNKPRSRGLLVAGGLAAIVLLAVVVLMLRGGGKGEPPSAALPTSSVVAVALLATDTPTPTKTPRPATATSTATPTDSPTPTITPSPTPTPTVMFKSGHFDRTAEAFRHWDQDDPREVPAACVKCHTKEGVPEFIKNNTNVAKTTSDGFTCTTCHVSLEDSQLYKVTSVAFPGGAGVTFSEDPKVANNANLCLLCHQGRESTASINEAIQGKDADKVDAALGFRNVHYFAAGATLFGTEVKGTYEFPDQAYNGRFMHVAAFQTCTDCHDSHELELKFDKCTTCHAGLKSPKEIRGPMTTKDYDGDGDTTEGIYGEVTTYIEKLYPAMQSYAKDVAGTAIAYSPALYPYFFVDTNADGQADKDEVVFDNTFNSWTPRLLQAAYNYQFVTKDPGAYAHNGKYIIQTLYDSLTSLGQQSTVDMTGMARPEATSSSP